MNNRVIKILISIITMITVMASILNATSPNPTVVDKTGRVIETTIRPTSETTIDPNTNDIAIKLKSKGNIVKQNDRSNNVVSDGIILPENENIATTSIVYTVIRHTNNVINANDENFVLNRDEKTGRLKFLIKQSNENGVYNDYVKNSFVKIDNKTYYFDKDGVMVLGNAYDTLGNYFYFDMETGELITEIQKKSPLT